MITTPPTGKLARRFGYRLTLAVLQSSGGFYLGTADEDGPVSRESVEYWPTEAAARAALDAGNWTQRESP